MWGLPVRQDPNLGIAESKSSYFLNNIIAYSEKTREFDVNSINRLAEDSEWGATRFPPGRSRRYN
jgi:hypothetical protein